MSCVATHTLLKHTHNNCYAVTLVPRVFRKEAEMCDDVAPLALGMSFADDPLSAEPSAERLHPLLSDEFFQGI